MKVGQRFKPYRVFNGIFIPESVVMLPNKTLSYGAKVAYGRLCRYAGMNDVAFPKQITLASEIGCSKRQVGNFIKQLKNFSLIEVERIGLKKPNNYYFLWHKIFETDFSSKKANEQNIATQEKQNTSPQKEQDISTPSIKESHFNGVNIEKETATAVSPSKDLTKESKN